MKNVYGMHEPSNISDPISVLFFLMSKACASEEENGHEGRKYLQ